MVADARRLGRAAVLGASFALCAWVCAFAAEPVDYEKHVKPILASRCYRCHGPVKQESGLRLDTAALAIKGGETGAAVVAGKSAESLLVAAVKGGGDMERMPKDGKPLTDAEIGVIAAWVDQGAVSPADEMPADPRDHWSFRTPVRAAVPAVKRAEWLRSPIDAFIGAEHDRRGLVGQADAPKHIILRRVYLDLVGLPPTVEEWKAFVADESPDALERVVDRLLTNPAYGERWGRHWMDVWRYSDWAGWTDGGQIRDSQPHIWRWRDWIVESLNRDKPYDQMVREMLAADEIAPMDESALRATGFLVRNYKMLSRETWMQDTVEHTAKSLLGLTINCARCHDHMYDPVTQEDYYRLRAIFEPHQVRIDRVPGEQDTKVDGLPRVYDGELTAATFLFTRGDDRFPEKDRPIAPSVPGVFRHDSFRVEPVSLAPAAHYPDLREHVHATLLKKAADEVGAARTTLAAKQKQHAEVQSLVQAATTGSAAASTDQKTLADGGKLSAEDALAAVTLAERVLATAEARSLALGARIAADKARHAKPPAAGASELAKLAALAHAKSELAAAEESLVREQQAVVALQRGDDNAKKQVPQAEQKVAATQKKVDAARKAVTAPGDNYPALGTAYPATSTGRRTALARWITDRGNPLTARVAINHMWLRHFGRALAPSVFDFGKNGAPPTHPELLDYLAVEWSSPDAAAGESAWEMKRVHRRIVTSSTYRMASTPIAAMTAADPDNIYYWRFEPRRLEAEVVRDGVLYVSQSLDQTHGGADIDHRQGLASRRRSMYFRHAPEKQMEFLRLFDAAAPTQCYQRQTSVMPQQALALANSRLTFVAARQLARELVTNAASDAPAFVAAAVERVLARPATPDEISVCATFLDEQTKFFDAERSRLQNVAAGPGDAEKPSAEPAMRARENLVHVLLNHHDFVTMR